MLHEQDQPPLLRPALDEACLRRQVGGPEVMRAQLRYPTVVAERPAVTMQVLPFASGAPRRSRRSRCCGLPWPQVSRRCCTRRDRGSGA
ncbi:Scr1 family TA system antitoxin-like transcriptional regulator [Streptomyces reniochalinae]|uniref:Scr1 family TA system antitoxin-like transcriptional regulator n=1 Tax=Streptomyces reniochalinae TaxID=2250578 RepID=UPI003CCC68C7